MLLLQISSWDVNHVANIVKGYALAIGVAFGMWIVWTWWRRKLVVDRLESQVRAKQAFARFTNQVMLQPEIAAPVPAEAGPQRSRYQKYVELLTTTADEILLLDPSAEWKAALGKQLAPHAEMLASPMFRDGLYQILSPATRSLVGQIVGPAASPAANVRPLRTGQA